MRLPTQAKPVERNTDNYKTILRPSISDQTNHIKPAAAPVYRARVECMKPDGKLINIYACGDGTDHHHCTKAIKQVVARCTGNTDQGGYGGTINRTFKCGAVQPRECP